MQSRKIDLDAKLHHLAFESPFPERLAHFYSNVLQMDIISSEKEEIHCSGPSREFIIIKGHANKLAYAGFVVENSDKLISLRSRIEENGISVLSNISRHFCENAFTVQDPDGNLICFGTVALISEKFKGLHARLQHLTFSSNEVAPMLEFYELGLGFKLTDRVIHKNGEIATIFLTSNHEHHTIACFKSDYKGMDHHSYEAGSWIYIRDWCDHFSEQNIQLLWGPGRHGPGDNLFVFIEDPDGNWIEISAELEIIKNRSPKDWPQHPRTLNKWGSAIMRS